MIKKIIKKILNEFIYGGHLIALGAVGIVSTSAILLNIKLTWDFLIIVYLLVFISILYNRWKERLIDYLTNPDRTKNLEKYFCHIFFIIISSSLIVLGVLVYFNKMISIFFVILLYIVAFLYTKYFKNITKKIIVFKNICFSLITGLLVIFLAIYYSYPLMNISFFLIFLFIFLRMFVNTIFLDIKDVESDKKQALLTIPILLRNEKTLIFLRWITILSVIPIVSGSLLGRLPRFSLMLLFVVPYSFYYFKKSENKKNFYLTNYFLADFEFILWLPLILIGKILI